MIQKVLVVGASGFLGSHVTKLLVASGRNVRVLIRRSSDSRTTDHLAIERYYGDVLDEQSLINAMTGCSSVFYCVADTRDGLRNTTHLHQVNLAGLYHAMDAAIKTQITKFIFASSFMTIGLNDSGLSSEADKFNWWDKAPDAIRCRVSAEKRLLEYCQDYQFPGIVCCFGNLYGKEDFFPKLHGTWLQACAQGKMHYYWKGGAPCVGVTDAAQAMLLAEQKGQVGERYAISERWLSYKELFTIGTKAAGYRPIMLYIPALFMLAAAIISSIVNRLRGKENRLSVSFVRRFSRMNDIDTHKAKTELGWNPKPIEQSIEEAVAFYTKHYEDLNHHTKKVTQ